MCKAKIHFEDKQKHFEVCNNQSHKKQKCREISKGYEMISVLLNWLYMAIITYMMGSLCLFLFGITQGVVCRIFTGILFVTCYAQIFSLFQPLSLWANVGLLCMAILSVILCRKSLLFPLHGTLLNDEGLSPDCAVRPLERKNKILTILIVAFFVLLFALCTAGPTRQYDTNYYHAQTIHWLEEYGCVKGAANLFDPLANNNAGHYFDAIFSTKFLTGHSLHTTGGFFGLLIWLHGFKLCACGCKKLLFGRKNIGRISVDEETCKNGKKKNDTDSRESILRKKNSMLYTGLGLAEMAYSVIMTAYYADPYTDILPNVLVFFVISEWIAEMTKKENDLKKITLLAVLALFAAICKLTVWPIALLLIVPLIRLVKNRNWKCLLCLFGVSLFTVLPTFATNAFISGYILYPVYFLDILNVPWKLDVGVLKWNVSSAVEFARLRTTDPFHPLNTGLSWFPFWLEKQATVHRVLYAYVLILFGTDVVSSLRKFLQHSLCAFDRKLLGLRVVCYVTLVYWFFTMPELRFVWSCVFVVVATIPASLVTCHKQESPEPATPRAIKNRKIPLLLWGTGIGLILLYTSLYGIRSLGYAYGGIKHALVVQADYDRQKGKTVRINGKEFVNEVIGEPYVCGYYLFPYFGNFSEESRLMVGDSIRDGFYFRN